MPDCLIEFDQPEVASTILAGAQASGRPPDLDLPVWLEMRAQLALVCITAPMMHWPVRCCEAGRAALLSARRQPGAVTWRATAGLAHTGAG